MSLWLAILALPRWVRLAGLVLASFAAFVIWDHFDDKAAVYADRAATAAAITKKQLAAERSANELDAARQAEIRGNDAGTRKAIEDAVATNPEAARAPAGPVTNRAVDELRRRAAGNSAAAGR